MTTCKKQQDREYYLKNKQKILDRAKKYYNDNKDKILQSRDASKLKEYNTNYKRINSEKISKYNKEYNEANSESIKEQRKQYRRENRQKINEYESNKLKTDELFRLAKRIRNRLNEIVRIGNFNKTVSMSKYLGCSLTELKDHIQSKFTQEMTWDNYGKWHIDHIKPLSLATNETELYELCHYTNLQPLWAIDNIKKGNKYNG